MHEQSETVQGPDGLWYNVFGRGTANAGTVLPGTRGHRTVKEAENEAERRSESFHGSEDPLDIQRYWERSYRKPMANGQQFSPLEEALLSGLTQQGQDQQQMQQDQDAAAKRKKLMQALALQQQQQQMQQQGQRQGQLPGGFQMNAQQGQQMGGGLMQILQGLLGGGGGAGGPMGMGMAGTGGGGMGSGISGMMAA